MSAPVDREQLRRDLSDALSAIQRDHDVTGLDVLAASLMTLKGPYGRLLQKGLAELPRNYSALICSLSAGAGQAGKNASAMRSR